MVRRFFLPPPFRFSIRLSERSVRRLLGPLAVGALVALLYGVNLGGWRTLGAHEALAAVPARAMAEGNGALNGGWLVPDFGGIPRVKKPPLGYWLIAVAVRLTGEADAFAARLPSAVAAVLLAGLVGWWATRWYGRRAGLAAALVQGTSLWALTYGRKAEVDMTLALLTAAALALVLTAPRDESPVRRRWRWAAVWALAGVGWLGKFHFVPTLIFAPLATWFLLTRRWGEWKQVASPVGLAAFAALALPWTAYMLLRVPAAGEAWLIQTAGRVGGALGARSLFFYPSELLLMTVPWTPLWAWVAARALRRHGRLAAAGWKTRPGDGGVRRVRAAWRTLAGRGGAAGQRLDRDLFPLIWLGATALVLSLSLGRNRHYLLPALPACSLMAGRGVAVAVSQARRGRTIGGRLRGSRANGVAWGLPAVGAAAFAAAVTFVTPQADGRAVGAAFLQTLPAATPDGEPILVVGMGESSALWHLPPTTRRTEGAAGLADALRRRGRVAALVDDRSAWLLGECETAWRASGGRFSLRWVARETQAERPAENAFEKLQGLRLAILEATPPSEPLTLRTAEAGGVILR